MVKNLRMADRGILINQSGSDLIDHQSSKAGVETPHPFSVTPPQTPPTSEELRSWKMTENGDTGVTPGQVATGALLFPSLCFPRFKSRETCLFLVL